MGEKAKPDFSGWATRANLKCSDGRTIMPDAFKHQDTASVPLVWQHGHNEPGNVLGHVDLENRDEGVYCYAFFNETDQAQNAKVLVQHEDIKSLSIYANGLVEKAKQVLHGTIREVSLVLSGANPGALIDNIQLAHAGTDDLVTLEDEAVIFTGLSLEHEDKSSAPAEDIKPAEEDGPTVQDVYDGMSEEQKNVVHYMVGAALEGAKQDAPTAEHSGDKPDEAPDDKKEGTTRMTRNVFEQTGGEKKDQPERHVLSHDAIQEIVADAKRGGSLKEAVEGYALKHGIDNIDVLFPDARSIDATPDFDKRRTEWVAGVLNGTKHSPFSRIKNLFADIRFEDARAKGYIKGTMKKEEFFGVAKRVTTPATIYKKQKLDRDDIIDITDFDVVAWLKGEMRLMLDEELARAILIGDGRAVDDEDKIKDPAGVSEGAGIRSIINDSDLYVATVTIPPTATPVETTDTMLANMSFYKGSGQPTLYTTQPFLTKMLLARDDMGRRLYRTASDLAAELTVNNVVTVEVMEDEPQVAGIVVNLRDYTIGADRGGDVSMFDDFDIDYNQYKYLIETRVSGALTKIRSAIVVRYADAGDTEAVPVEPAFDPDTGVLTPATTAGVTYKRADTNATVTTGAPITLAPGDTLKIYAVPDATHYFENNVDDEWTFSRDPA